MAALMQQLQRQLVPYTVLLVVPLLRRMSDPAAAVRKRAALCFGGLTALLPLAQGMPLPSGLDEAQRKAAEQDAEFLNQLLDNKRVEDYSLPVKLKVCGCLLCWAGLAHGMLLGASIAIAAMYFCPCALRSHLGACGMYSVASPCTHTCRTVQLVRWRLRMCAHCVLAVSQVELRRYQQEGINWLSFLRRFGLSGVLADDMGLGKTLQATTIMACSAAERQAAALGSNSSGSTDLQQQQAAGEGQVIKQEASGQQEAGTVQQLSDQLAETEPNLQQQVVKQEPTEQPEQQAGQLPLSEQTSTKLEQQQQGQVKLEQQSHQQQQQPVQLLSLVVCPSTLVGHWAHEVNKYVDSSVLKPLAVSGTPAERAAAVRRLQGPEGFNVVVISYESLRSDVDWAAGVVWDYVILDEGHVIRSTKSKLAQV